MIKKLTFIFTVISFIAFLLGCATVTGPSVSRQEIEKTREELKVKALAFQVKQLQRLYNIGNRLMLAFPSEDIRTPAQPFLGIVCAKIDKYLKQIYNLSVDGGVVIVVVKEKSPAYNIGLQPGDELVSLNKTMIRNINQFNGVVSGFKVGDLVEIEILREGNLLSFRTYISSIPINLPIIMVDMPEVNAATDGRAIFITYGLLNFAKSDDEIAAVLAHELAHAARGHVAKMQGGQIFNFLTALALGMVAESSSPGSGEVVMRGVGQLGNIFTASYSRDLEREADYFGTRFVYSAGYNVEVCATVEERFAIEIPATLIQNYLSTHPSSAERVVRIRKTIEELKTGRPASEN